MGVIAEAVRHLIAAGVTGDDLVTSIADMESAQNPVRSSGAVRQARYRQREKERNALRNVDNERNAVTPNPEPVYSTRAPAVIPVGISNDIPPIDSPLPSEGPPKAKKPKAPTPQEILSVVVSEKTAVDIVAHRKALRKPLTPRAAELLSKNLAASGDAERAAETMIERGWHGYRADWDGAAPNARAGPAHRQEKRNPVFQAYEELMAERYGPGTEDDSEQPPDVFEGPTIELGANPRGAESHPGGLNGFARDDAASLGERVRHEGDALDLRATARRFAG